MKRGDIVKFRKPGAGEAGREFVILELRGDRVLVGVTDPHRYGIAPTFVYLVSDLELVKCAC
jgi:hypothetical protein